MALRVSGMWSGCIVRRMRWPVLVLLRIGSVLVQVCRRSQQPKSISILARDIFGPRYRGRRLTGDSRRYAGSEYEMNDATRTRAPKTLASGSPLQAINFHYKLAHTDPAQTRAHELSSLRGQDTQRNKGKVGLAGPATMTTVGSWWKSAFLLSLPLEMRIFERGFGNHGPQ